MSISIVIPVFNEAGNILELFNQINNNISKIKETLIIYDFKEDNTLPVIDANIHQYRNLKIKLVKNDISPGVINALKVGLNTAKGKYILVLMADLSDDLRIVDKMLEKLNNGCDIVCGSRYMKDGKQIALADFVIGNRTDGRVQHTKKNGLWFEEEGTIANYSVAQVIQAYNANPEIQVRTVAQHLWAEASHKLQYKSETSVPEPVLRAIFRVSALLETVDLEFDRVLDERDLYRQKLDPKALIDNLNADSLEVLLDSILPPQNKNKKEEYGELLIELSALGIKSPDELEKLLNKNLDEVLEKDSREVRRRAIEKDFIEDDEESRVIEKGVFFVHTVLVRSAFDLEFGSDWRSKVSEFIRESE